MKLTHVNNLDFLRIVFAIFVVITHSYILSGYSECDLLCQLTDGQTSLSYIGVRGFFIISGYLIFLSLLRSRNLPEYFWKRVLRIFPGLFVALLLTVLLAPFVYHGSIPYIKNREALTYLPNNLFLVKTQGNIAGVFETNKFRLAINGSLWTIRYEFLLYIIIVPLFFIKSKTVLTRIILLAFFIFLYAGQFVFIKTYVQNSFTAAHMLDFAPFFIGGSVLASFSIEKLRHKLSVALLGVLILVASAHFHIFNTIVYLVLPFTVILFGLASTKFINNIGSTIGDLSFGVYIYSFPVQQTLMYFFNLDAVPLFFFSLTISLFLAYLSWHFIEKRALRLKSIRFKSILRI